MKFRYRGLPVLTCLALAACQVPPATTAGSPAKDSPATVDGPIAAAFPVAGHPANGDPLPPSPGTFANPSPLAVPAGSAQVGVFQGRILNFEFVPNPPCVGDRLTIRGRMEPGDRARFQFGPASFDRMGRSASRARPNWRDYGDIVADETGAFSFSFDLTDLSPTIEGGTLVIQPETEYHFALFSTRTGGAAGKAFRTCAKP